MLSQAIGIGKKMILNKTPGYQSKNQSMSLEENLQTIHFIWMKNA